jgi:hypothetical protein
VIAWWRWAIVVVWVTTLAVGSLNDGGLKQSLGTQGSWHREIHWISFAATAVVVGWCLAARVGPGLAATAAFLMGLGCELMQRVLYIPVVEWQDVADDAAGAAAGWLVLAVWRRWRVGRAVAVA